jgi:hypothetical protein
MQSSSAFVGIERNNTSALGKLTLFLVGLPTKAQVEQWIDTLQEQPQLIALPLRLSHLYFGVEGSFDGMDSGDWVALIKHFVREGFWCTLQMKASQVTLISKTGLCRQARFIPLISVALPQTIELGSTATLRVSSSTGGEWSLPLSSVTSRATNNAPITFQPIPFT